MHLSVKWDNIPLLVGILAVFALWGRLNCHKKKVFEYLEILKLLLSNVKLYFVFQPELENSRCTKQIYKVL